MSLFVTPNRIVVVFNVTAVRKTAKETENSPRNRLAVGVTCVVSPRILTSVMNVWLLRRLSSLFRHQY